MLNGPMVWWELVTLARRGHTVRARILLLYTLLLAVIVFAFGWFRTTSPIPFFLGTADPLPHQELAKFARWLVFSLLEAQLVLVAVITPAYTAAAISEEKDRRTLQLLLTTALTDSEIVWGKAVARILFVLAAVASGIPVLIFFMFLGGVDIALIAIGYGLTIGTAILSGGIGICAACESPDTRTTLIRAYVATAILVGGMLPPLMLLNPFAVLFYCLEMTLLTLQLACGLGYPIVQAVIACGFLVSGTRALRNAGVTGGPFPSSAFPEPPRGRPEPVVAEPSETLRAMGELGNADPVLWKERHAKAQPMPLAAALTALGAAIALILFIGGGWTLVKRAMQALDPDHAVMLLTRGSGSPDQASQQLMTAGLIASVLYLLPLAIGVTGCIAGERLRGTLDSLLATRLDRRRMLAAKIRAQTERGLVFAGGAATGLGAGFGSEGGVQLGLAAIAAFAGGIALVVGLGAWLSVRCATPVGAFRMCLPATVAVVGVPLLAWYFIDWQDVAPVAEAFAWCAGAFLLIGGAGWWRACVELERGD
ncbi:MAG: hypothetical protein K8U57_25555 [Planctomycetes bacterium]|nr:hypothetical protein [Planctomycetota bacterium]